MSTYRAGLPPADPKRLASFLQMELRKIEAAMQDAVPYARLQVLHVEPARLYPGMVVIADGSDWDPGSGAGIYRRSEANDAWVFVG